MNLEKAKQLYFGNFSLGSFSDPMEKEKEKKNNNSVMNICIEIRRLMGGIIVKKRPLCLAKFRSKARAY